MADTFLRQWAMLKLIPHAPRKVDSLSLRAGLQAQGFDVDLRTLQRDLKGLSAVFPMRCDSRSKPFGWQWMSGGRALDVAGMSPPAALALKLMDLHLRPLLPRSTLKALEPQLRSADEVLAQISDRAIGDWPRKVRVIPSGLALLPPDIDEAVLPVVYEALFTNRRFRARYLARDSAARTAHEDYVINPLALVSRGAVLYLVCTLFDYTELRLLVVHRMAQAELTEEPAHIPKDFDLDTYIAKGEFDISSGQLIRLRAILHKHAAQYLTETALSKDQRLRELDDGRVQITASVMQTAQLRWWLLSFGDQVEVLAPDALRQDLMATAQRMLDHYKNPANMYTR